MPLPLLTDRLTIRPLVASDAADVFALYGDPRVLRFWNSGPVADLDEARRWTAEQGAAHAVRGYAQWHASERESGRFVGCLGLQPLDDEVELLYALMPDSWGRGLATEAGTAALGYGFEEAVLECVVGIARQANRPSICVLRRLGMRSRWASRSTGAAAGRSTS